MLPLAKNRESLLGRGHIPQGQALNLGYRINTEHLVKSRMSRGKIQKN
jgi:hypothetical protein